jgi:hypothetical protein
VAICKECHRNEHSGKIRIECWVATSKGRKLICDYKYGSDGASDASNASDAGESASEYSNADTECD